MTTDGISCRLSFVKPLVEEKEKKPAGFSRSAAARKKDLLINTLPYIDELKREELGNKAKPQTIIAIDPGAGKIMCCMSGQTHSTAVEQQEPWEKTAETRAKIMNLGGFALARKKKKKEIVPGFGKSLVQMEKEFGDICKEKKVDRNSLQFNKFYGFLRVKFQFAIGLLCGYSDESFRIARFRQHSCKQRWEDTLLNNFEQKFGEPSEDLLVCMGNWNETSCFNGHMKRHAPRGAVGRWCKLLMKRGYKVALVDEHYTSKRCSSCKLKASQCKPIKEVQNGKLVEVWRKTKCNVCSAEHNRDVNGCLNMLAIVRAHARGEARPEYLDFPGYKQVLDPQKVPACKIVREAKPHDESRKRYRMASRNQATH